MNLKLRLFGFLMMLFPNTMVRHAGNVLSVGLAAADIDKERARLVLDAIEKVK